MFRRTGLFLLIPFALLLATIDPAHAGTVAPAACQSSHLTIFAYITSNPGLGDGPQNSVIGFQNTGSSACSLTGNPGVSATLHGSQVGQPATWVHSGPKTPVTIKPGETAHAVLRNVGTRHSKCHPVTADAIKVFAPNAGPAQSVAYLIRVCTSKITNLRVGVVKPGSGQAV